MEAFKSYRAFFEKSLQAHLAYGGSLLITLATSAVSYLITVMIWHYVFSTKSAIAGFYAYLTLGFILSYSYNIFLERTIGERIREGLVATDLLKPLDFQLFYMVRALSDVLFQVFVALIIWVLGLLTLGHDMLPASPLALGAFFISFFLAFFVQYGICFIFIQAIFITNSNYGAMASRNALQQAFSGAFAPLTLFPPLLRSVAACLPFQFVVYVPAAIYLGWIHDADLPKALIQQLVWAVCLLMSGRIIFNAIVSKITIQGG